MVLFIANFLGISLFNQLKLRYKLINEKLFTSIRKEKFFENLRYHINILYNCKRFKSNCLGI